MYKHLLSPIKIRGLELRNRSVMTGMGTQFPGRDRLPTDQMVAYHQARAQGGVGLNTVEVSSVHQPTAPPYFLSLGQDKAIPYFQNITDAIHEAGGKASVQLWQAGINAGLEPEVPLLVPSDLKLGEHVLPAMSKELISEVVESFGSAAARAVSAGFDTMEIHAGHSYLIHTFLSPQTNHREDEYGETLENRARFLLEIITAIRENIPQDMPLFMRINAMDDYYEQGLTLEDVITICTLAGEKGVDVLNVSRGNTLSPLGLTSEVPSLDYQPGFNISNAAKIKEATGLPVIGVGRLHHPDQAEKVLQQGQVDMVAMSRAHLADPEIITKTQEGRIQDIVLCTGCNQGCFDAFIHPDEPHISCLFNPGVGREKEMELVPAPRALEVMVVGAGPVGMEIALQLFNRGHHPSLYDKNTHLGGRFIYAGKGPRKQEFRTALEYMEQRMAAADFPIHLGTTVTPELIESVQPDVVFLALGGTPLLPAGQGPWHTAEDVFDQTKEFGQNVAVMGGGIVGLEVAETLQKSIRRITVFEKGRKVGTDLGRIRTPLVLQRLANNGVTLVDELDHVSVEGRTVDYQKNGQSHRQDFDDIIACLGTTPRDTTALENTCKEQNIPCHVIASPEGSDLMLHPFREGAIKVRTFDL